MKLSFSDPQLLHWLDTNIEEDYDNLDFGVVQMNHSGKVTAYNITESRLSGILKENAKGKHFFTQVAPCTNNFMVAEKYNNPVLDETLPYIFTYITKPTKVELRIIKGTNGNQYLLARNA